MAEPIGNVISQSELRQKIERDLQARNLRRLTPEEYAAAQAEQHARVLEQEQAQARMAIDYTRFGLQKADFQLSWNYVQPGQSDGYKGLEAVKAAYERGWGMLLLHGTYGQAKTLIGKILVVTALKAHKTTAYANMSAVLDDIRLAYDEQERKTTELIRRMAWWMDLDVLFLDEIDRCNATEWAKERMFQLLDGRYTRAIREEALTVLASNRGENDLDGYIRSRLKDGRLGPIVYMNGKDGRKAATPGTRW